MAIDDYMLYYPLDEGSGTTAYDNSGNNYDGTINGADWITTGEKYVLDFPNDADNVEYPDLNIFDGTQSFTISIQANFYTYTDEGYVYLINVPDRDYGIYKTSSDNIGGEWYDTNNDVYSIYSSQDFPLDEWTHIVVRYDASNGHTLFQNGSDVTGGAGLDDTWTGDIRGSTTGGYIGDDYGNILEAEVGDFRVYDRALSDSEISDLYNAMPSYVNTIEATTSPQIAVSPSSSTFRERHTSSSPVANITTTATGNQIASGESSPNVDINSTSTMTKLTQAFADLATAVGIDSSTLRIRSTDAGVEIEISPLVELKDFASATVTINPQALTTAKRIVDAQASIETAASVLADFVNQLKAQVSVESEIATQFDDVRYRVESSGINIVADVIAENDRIRYGNVEVEIDALGWDLYGGSSLSKGFSDTVSGGTSTSNFTGTIDGGDSTPISGLTANAIFGGVADIQMAIDVSSLLYQWAKASTKVGVNVESIASRIVSGKTSIEVELGLEADGTKTWVVMVFESLAAGDTIHIDTEELTILDQNGNNLRSLMDVKEWVEASPDDTLTLQYDDESPSRDVTIKVEEKDRYI